MAGYPAGALSPGSAGRLNVVEKERLAEVENLESLSASKPAVRFALVGLGRAGHFHLTSFRMTPKRTARLEVVIDQNEKLAREVAEEAECSWSTKLDEGVLAKVDAVIVASTTDTHYGYCKSGLLAGKAVFTEKPISHHPEEVHEILELGKKSVQPFVVGYQRRCDKNYRALHKQVPSLGDIRMVKCCSRDNPFPPMPYLRTSGGIFQDMLSHDFDMIHYLTGRFPTAVYSVGHAYLPEIREMDDVDTVCVLMKFDGGLIATVDSSRISAPGYDQRVEIFGEHGVAFVQNEVESTVQVGTKSGFSTPVAAYSFPQRYKETYFQEMTEFILMCQTGAVEDEATIDRHNMIEKVCIAAELSCRLGREVKLEEVDRLHKEPKVPYTYTENPKPN